MKIRNDFVTNSSSSSFILAFKDEKEVRPWGTSWESFKECCDDYDYNEFFKLIDDLKNDPDNTDKEEALKTLAWQYECIRRYELTDHLSWEERREYEKSEEYKEEIQKYLETNKEYLSKKKKIEEADLVVSGMIWDSNGGILEYAIRNDFIKNNFYGCHVTTWHVG